MSKDTDIVVKGKTSIEVATELYDKNPGLLMPSIGLITVMDWLDILAWDLDSQEYPAREAAIQLLKPLAQKLIDQGDPKPGVLD